MLLALGLSWLVWQMFGSQQAYNAAHGTAFRLALALDAFGNYSRSATAIINDLNYFRARYAGNAAFVNRYGGEPMVMLMASRRFAQATIQAVSSAAGSGAIIHMFQSFGSMMIGMRSCTSWVNGLGSPTIIVKQICTSLSGGACSQRPANASNDESRLVK